MSVLPFGFISTILSGHNPRGPTAIGLRPTAMASARVLATQAIASEFLQWVAFDHKQRNVPARPHAAEQQAGDETIEFDPQAIQPIAPPTQFLGQRTEQESKHYIREQHQPIISYLRYDLELSQRLIEKGGDPDGCHRRQRKKERHQEISVGCDQLVIEYTMPVILDQRFVFRSIEQNERGNRGPRPPMAMRTFTSGEAVPFPIRTALSHGIQVKAMTNKKKAKGRYDFDFCHIKLFFFY